MNCKIIGLKINLNLWIYVDSVPDTSFIQEYISEKAPEVLRQQIIRESKTYSNTHDIIIKTQELKEIILFSEQLLKSSSPSSAKLTQLMLSIQRPLPSRAYMQLYLSDNHTAIFELHVLLSKIVNNPNILNNIYIMNFLENIFELNLDSRAFCFTFAIKRFAEIIAQISPSMEYTIDEFLSRYRDNFNKEQFKQIY
ncbi:MAG: hypothetical protein WCH76_02290 [Candidatus Riflemargulisbacteria bacterium]